MAVADLSLALNVQSSGTAEIDKLVSALNKYSDKVEQIKTQKAPDTAPWEKFGEGVRNAIQNPLQAAGNAAEGFLKAIGPIGAGLGVAAAGFGALFAAGSEAAHALGALGIETANTAIRLGISAGQASQLGIAAKMAGGDVGSFETAMRMLSQGLAENSEKGKAAREQLQAWGISAKSDTLTVLEQVGMKLNGMTNQYERNAAAVAVLGRSGLTLLPILMQMGENLDAVKAAGLGLTDSATKEFEKLHRQTVLADEQFAKLKRDYFSVPLASVWTVVIDWAWHKKEGEAFAAGPFSSGMEAGSTGWVSDLFHGTAAGPPRPGMIGSAEAAFTPAEIAASRARMAGKAADTYPDKYVFHEKIENEPRTRHPSLLVQGMFGGSFYAMGANAPTGGETGPEAYGQGLIDNLKKLREAQLEAARMDTVYQERQVGATRGKGQTFGQEKDEALRITQIKLDGLQKEIDLGEHLYDADLKRTQIIRDGEQAILDIKKRQLEMSERMAEQATQEALDRARAMASGIFAGLTNPRGPGEGLRQFGMGQLNQLEGQMFSNLATPALLNMGDIFRKAGGGAAGGSGFIDKLLKGTMFEAPDKNAVKPSIDAATKSVDALRGSVDALTGTLGGTPPAGGLGYAQSLYGAPFGTLGGGLGGIIGGLLGPGVSNSANAIAAALGGQGLAAGAPFTSAGLNPIDAFSALAAGGAGSGGTKAAAAADSSTRARAIADIGKGVAAGFEIYNGAKTGGAKGGLEMAAGGLMAASMIPGPQQPFILAGAAILSMIGSMFGDPKQMRQNQITKELTDWHYFAPEALSSMMGMGGNLANYDERGNVRGTPYSGWRFDTTQSHYGHPIDGQTTFVPGSVQPIYITVSTMDAKSFQDNAHLVAAALYAAIQQGHPVNSAIRAVTGTG
jgi:hypothetical protein